MMRVLRLLAVVPLLLAAAAALAAPETTLAAAIPKTSAEMSPILRTVVLVTLLGLVPTLLIAMTSFTRIVITLSFLRHALGMPETPPNAVLVTLAMILTLFTMAPVTERARADGLQPWLDGKVTLEAAAPRALAPFKAFMLDHAREEDLEAMRELAHAPEPKAVADTPMTVLLPAFMLSELRAAFIAGFMIFLPFLLIDLVVATLLMALGMMMVPPVTISLPLKLLLFVMIDGWGLVVRAIASSYAGA
ncbi:flagellar type III secretion system pore protein FliP [Niveibacterium sp. COAC-50]|uniref:flagellar type III secretion system pore protein FliP n=1 Tax=Niveibacterium sp. COAC-50 TaxID=2729384 RepID=UPI00155430DF|nr:flagellar type III secretion system pore protein FliP [Niveibacterium sp. COAC-50]